MSRSDSSSKGAGHEMWSRRPQSGELHCSENKRICHGIERAQAKQEIVKVMVYTEDDADSEVWMRYSDGTGDMQPDAQYVQDTIRLVEIGFTSSPLRYLCYDLLLHGY